MPGRQFTAGIGYRYGFNGKELENNKSEYSYNFGARIFDGRICRFFSKDLLRNEYESQYVFAGNSPIGTTDYNGYFKISPLFAQRYPTLAKMLSAVLPNLKNDVELRDRWITSLGFDDVQTGIRAWEEMLTYGQGPWVTPERPESELRDKSNIALRGTFFDNENGGEYDPSYPENITISSVWLNNLESFISHGDDKEAGFQMFVVFQHIMHEGGHWARQTLVQKRSRKDYCYEDGALVEEALFEGNRFSYTKCFSSSFTDQRFSEKKAREYYNNKYKTEFLPLGSKSGIYVPRFGMCFGSGGIKSMKTPKGQAGDPTLKENGDENPPKKDNTETKDKDFSYQY